MIIWLCGGAWTEMDRNVWMPELVWFAKKGFVIASVDYSVTARTRFPQQIVEGKCIIMRSSEMEELIGISDRIIAFFPGNRRIF